MAKIAECKADVVYAGPYASELQAFAAPGSWTKDKSEAFTALIAGLAEVGYRSFSGSATTLGLLRKGQSAIYRVPSGQRGALAAYAEKYVHIVCVHRTDNFSGRMFAFTEVSSDGKIVGAAKVEGE